MWYLKTIMRALPVFVMLAAVTLAHPARAAVLDVCATCPYTTLNDAFDAAEPGDTIILDGPDNDVSMAPITFTLTTDLVIDSDKSDITIRGDSKARPDQIIIEGTGSGPVITVEQNETFEIRGVTISGGSTGILAMEGSNVEIVRCLIDGSSGVGLDCVNPEEVYIAGSVITNCTGDATRIDMGGELNITQCTFISNTGLGVNAIAGLANVVATMIHDSGAGMEDVSGSALDIAGCYVTDAAGAVLATPVIDAYAFTTPLDTATAFETTDPFPGEFDELYADFPLSGASDSDLDMEVSVEFYERDFSNVLRGMGDVVIGADERGVAGTAPAWLECFVIQNGRPSGWVGEGQVTIEIFVENVSLANATVWIANPTQTVPSIGLADAPANRFQVVTFLPGDISQIDANYGIVEFPLDLDDFEAAFPNIPDVNTTDYEIFVQPDGETLASANVLDQPEAAGSQAEFGRIFGFDTIPPRVVSDLFLLADQYIVAPNDGQATSLPLPDYGVVPGLWGDGRLQGDIGANEGFLEGSVGDPQVFFNIDPTDVPGTLDFNIQVTFVDLESGFGPDANSGPWTASGDKAGALYAEFADTPGYPWWSQNAESQPELINSTAGLNVTYVNNGTTLTADWTFTDAVYDTVNMNQWYATASIRVMDLAGNETVLRPFHLWWFPGAQAQFRSGPAGTETANPVFTWGLNRFGGGQDPKDPFPVDPSAQWRVWIAVSPGTPGTGWVDISGAWSAWMPRGVRSIGLDTPFNTTGDTLRSLMVAAAGGASGEEFLIAVRGYDEAGNLQATSAALNGNLPDVGSLIAENVSYHRWTDPGVSASVGLDTAVQTTLWHNAVSGAGSRDRVINPGDQSFGATSRIPIAEAPCDRVEAGFDIEMSLPDTNPVPACDPVVAFQLFEDGRLVSSGWISPSAAPAGQFDFVIPDDLLNAPPGWVILDTVVPDNRAFLNASRCGATRDRLGDDGPANAEPPFGQRDVKYQVLLSTGIPTPAVANCTDFGNFAFDLSPAVVEFTVTVDRQLKDEQPIKSFTQE